MRENESTNQEPRLSLLWKGATQMLFSQSHQWLVLYGPFVFGFSHFRVHINHQTGLVKEGEYLNRKQRIPELSMLTNQT